MEYPECVKCGCEIENIVEAFEDKLEGGYSEWICCDCKSEPEVFRSASEEKELWPDRPIELFGFKN